MSTSRKSSGSPDPYVVLPKEKARYADQFKSLKPNNGIITGEQAKGFFLQSQLPPYVLGQIWAVADTDSDGKMDINEFSIACKLINLKIRGFDVPKTVPPALLSSLKSTPTPPAIPPLPNTSMISAPPRPEPPKVAPLVQQPLIQPVMSNQMLLQNSQSAIGSNNIGMGPMGPEGVIMGVMPPASACSIPTMSPGSGIPTGVVPPMFTNIQPALISCMPPIQPLNQPPLYSTPLPPAPMNAPLTAMPPLVPGMHPASGVPASAVAPMPTLPSITSLPSMTPLSTTTPSVPIVPANMSPGGVAPSAAPAGPGTTGTPRGSIPGLDRTLSTESVSSQPEWTVPHSTKLKYTQIFNTTDRTKSGFLSGAQARNVMVQTKLPQGVLAQIWALADMDSDGRLGCEEFVLAMYLCEQAQLGNPPPTKLPLDLIPPSFRRSTRTASISSQGSGAVDQDPASTLLQNSFEDKRKENFEKGQAELERRRKTLQDQQRQEREERERKEREEQEKKEKARQEAERKRLDELERQMREQQEKERQLEEERKRQAEQREAARKEMERQRQLEWEKQRLQELQQQRQREQENVLKLKAKNQSLTIELTSLNDQVKELSQKICDTRMGVSNVKSTIDGMRSTRDSQMQEMAQLKNKLKEQNAKLLSLSQEKLKLEARNKINSQDSEQARIAFENKDITIKNLRKKVEDMEAEIDNKLLDIENNNSQLGDLQHQMKELVKECEQLYSVYELKRDTVLEMKNVSKETGFDVWKSTDAWAPTAAPNEPENWPVDNWGTATAETAPVTSTTPEGMIRYRALYEFVARNSDEISFQPGDIINVPAEQTGEPGWLAGEIRGKTGWFPESYVEPVDGISVRDDQAAVEAEDIEAKRLEGIAEMPEGSEANNSIEPVPTQAKPEAALPESEPEYFVANYAYQSEEAGDLTFNAGEIITVLKQEGDWWTGKLGDNVGLFPSNYVQKIDMTTNQPAEDIPVAAVNSTPAVNSTSAVTTTINNVGVSAEAVESALEYANAQVDNEVNQINQNKPKELPFDPSIQANAQTIKSKKPEIASVIAAYQSTSPEQLSLARGQLIMIRKKTNSGWWEGELQAKGRKRQVGWFPASYVKVLSSSGRASGRTTPVSSTRMQQEVVIDKVIALYSYTAHHPDELTFAKDDIISVTAREEELWWRGELNGVSGMFPSNYVAPLQQQQFSSPRDKKRQESIKEFIQTEQAYVNDMSIVHEVFELPLRQSKLISEKEINDIFVNWQEIIECNRNFMLDLLTSYNSDSETVGDVICRHLPRMTAYITFCGKQLDSAALLQRLTVTSTAFRDLVKKCQANPATKGMPLSSFLIKPMQRITRYPLLITKIMENTPEDHRDYKYLEEALRVAEKFLNCVNENVRLKEVHEQMDWLQQCIQNDLNLTFDSQTNKLGPRQLLHYGLLIKLKNNKELIGFLFNDFFMLVQASKSIGCQFSFQRNTNITYKMYKQPILIKHLTITRDSTDNVENGTDSNRVLNIQDDKSQYKIALLATTVHECSLWMKRIESAREVYTKLFSLSNQNKRKTQAHLGPACGRILVLVQKGKRFISSGKPHSENIYCKVSLGSQEQETDIAKENFSNGNAMQNGVPQIPALVWNYSMQFQIRNINQETLTFVVYEQNPYSPDEFLGKAELRLKDILWESQNHNGPIVKKLILHQVESGELTVKLDLHLFGEY